MFEHARILETGVDQLVACGGILVVRLAAGAPNREIYANVFVNGTLVANGSAADNAPGNIISTNLDTITVPVPTGATVRIDRVGSGTLEARLYTF